LKN
jgi:hypothetical protein